MFGISMLALLIISIIIIIILYRKNKSYKARITGLVEGPILIPDELQKHGQEIALSHSVTKKARSCSNLLPRMEENYRHIIKAYRELNGDAVRGKSTVPAAEWLFDNFYVIEEQVKDIRINFPKGRHSILPCLNSGLLKGFPRIYDIALELIGHTDGRLDEKLLMDFLKAYQSKSQLISAEIWAVPIMLKIALIEDIRHICDELESSRQDKRKADELADLILEGSGDQSHLIDIIKTYTADMEELSPAFAERLIMRARRYGCDIGPIMHYIDEKLASQDTSAAEIIQSEHQEQAKNQVSIGNCITSLRLISVLDWHNIFEALSPVEQTLRDDPAGVYPAMDFASRDYYRHGVEDMARKLNVSEAMVAKKAVDCARVPDDVKDVRLRHVGYYIVGRGREKLESILGYRPGILKRAARSARKHPTLIYLLPVFLITIGISWGLALYTGDQYKSLSAVILTFLLCLLPASEIAVEAVNWAVTHLLSPAYLPKYELGDGIPQEYASFVVIPALISNEARVKQLMDELEVYYLANKEENVFFALLSDFTDAQKKDMPGDEAIVRCGLELAAELNKKYKCQDRNIFFFLQRYREFNKSQGVWMGWERKRGKLMEFNKLLRGSDDTTYYVISGDLSKLPKIKYVITLDADTQLPRDAARRLIGTLSHPLNSAIMDEYNGRVVHGYGVLQPRVTIDIINANKTLFSKIFAGQGGIDPYTTAVSDIYMDLFGEGIYTGKGIYDVDVFLKLLDGYIPENAVLSHDLLEGAYVRAGLVTDIELVDGFPSTYSSYTTRLHRWVRGDWQLLPWLRSRVKDEKGDYAKNPLSVINRWKILDNLRRSLMSPALMLLIIFSLLFISESSALRFGLAALAVAFPVFTGLADALLSRSALSGKGALLVRSPGINRNIGSGILNMFVQIFLLLIFLPYKAYLMMDAIIRTVIRLKITKIKLLEWETAADAEARLKKSKKSYMKIMWICTAASLVALSLTALYSRELVWVSLPLSLLWLTAPYVALYVSRAPKSRAFSLSAEDKVMLRLISRKTWRYFDEFVGEKDNFLPPDNFQMDPPNGAAHRTSPTNIGLYLVSVMAARDMGYISTGSMIERLQKTFDSMDKLDRWKGHFYNWYDTITMQPLRPLYISTVDSGNLIGYLMTLNEGLKEYGAKPVIDTSQAFGLMDLIRLYNNESKLRVLECKSLEKLCEMNSMDPLLLKNALEELKANKREVEKTLKPETPYSGKLDEAIESYNNELIDIFPWIQEYPKMPEKLKSAESPWEEAARSIDGIIRRVEFDMSLTALRDTYKEGIGAVNLCLENADDVPEVKNWLKAYKGSLMKGYLNVNRKLSRIKELRERSGKIIEDTRFAPLFDERRQLFSIGYSAEEEQLNRSYYDLLASEARQTSFIAIAKGDVDQKHWFRLGRSLTSFGSNRGLVSWSGTMFEYLMPLLIMKNYENTLLDDTYKFALKSQIAYGKMRNVPWGVSESGFAAFDMALNYQYSAFGVPRLGLKRGLVNDMVIAPYATLMALMVDPEAALKNIKALKDEGLDGPYGFYEACDFTIERVPAGKKKAIVKSFMVHHHGMSLLALDNCINDNIMQKRFHNNPLVKATELLLQERVPGRIVLTKDIEDEATPEVYDRQDADEFIKEIGKLSGAFPEAHILSNGSMNTVLTDRGTGYIKFRDISVTRWREQQASGSYGMFIYICNINSNDMWSASYEPCRVKAEGYKVIFSSDKVEYQRTDGSIDTRTEVVVSPEDNVEIRRVSLTNHSSHWREIEVTSYFEVVISSQGADAAHPVFNNLFVRTEFDSNCNTLFAARRPREAKQKPVWLMHKVIAEGETLGSVQYETDRMKFIGRGRKLSSPAAMEPDHPLSNTSGAVLDPIMSLRRRVRIRPGETAKLSYVTGIAYTRKDAASLADKYNDEAAVRRAFELAWTRSQVEAKYLGLKSKDIELYQSLLSHILFISPARRAREETIIKNTKGQSGLWPLGISGDVPIVVVSVGGSDELDIAEYMLKAHEYWRTKGIEADLVILNEDSGDYMQSSMNRLRNMILSSHGADIQDRRGGVFLRQSSSISPDSLNLIYVAARLVLKGDAGSIRQQLKAESEEAELEEIEYKPGHLYSNEAEPMEKLMFWNGIGGFSKSGNEYVIRLQKGQDTPAPWSNVVCNESFGFLATSSGGGYSWAENSREFKLTPWSNDPVSDTPGEVIYVMDAEEKIPWSISPLPVREDGTYVIRHGFGYSIFEHISRGIRQEMTLFVPQNGKVKVTKVKLKNISDRKRKLSVAYYIRPVLGVSDESTAPFIVTMQDEKTGVMLIRNGYSDDFPGRVVFMDCSIKERTVSGDRMEFIGPWGDLSKPMGPAKGSLSGNMGGGLDPCGSIMVNIELKPHQEEVVIFTLGEGESDKEAIDAALNYRNIYNAERAYRDVRLFWSRLLGTIKVSTPDESLNTMVNGWLMYQTICCRMWARSAFYQSGGAYGFRDQLQDSMAAAYLWPELTRKQILLHSSRQYTDGDVQHWWHPVTGKGIRTKFSDDLLWLPYVTADYIQTTGDSSILDEEVNYIEDEPLGEEEDERYNTPKVSCVAEDVYNHCIRSIERSLKFGEHGIPLMGSGDWNDGMNTVGNRGRGESVWLGWFLYKILRDFAPICSARGDEERAGRYLETALSIKNAIEKKGWDGSWYRRAYFDDGRPLGSASNSECRIDSIAQSWSIISGAGSEARAEEAMRALDMHLVNRDAGLIKLLSPPFDNGDTEPGYIKGYVPGVRENGGQYTHAAVWVILAYAMMGRGNEAWELFSMINPINHTSTAMEYARYKVEPYVMAADVYAVEPHSGRGGWTWYTGASGWMYRVCIEHILGLKLRGDRLIIDPCIPDSWPEYTVKYCYIDTVYIITVKNKLKAGPDPESVKLDGKLIDGNTIQLINDKSEHRVEVTL